MPDATGRIMPISVPRVPWHEEDCDKLRDAAMWVVLMWDAEQSQHAAMPALREALGLPRERPTRDEAHARLSMKTGPE